MQGSTVVKLLIAAAIAFFAWKWWTAKNQPATAKPSTSPAVNCQFEARSAADFWSSNVTAFKGPPYDMGSWEEFKSHIDDRISRAEGKCSCGDDDCTHGKEAMTELRIAVNEMDAAVRSGGEPPSDLVQRAERIDHALR
ncbi:MAG TPA: hypothetical protein VLV78_13210 [Thermoanaerobaculia bacterium]|nr:hypothetical protein [Thermoanaerobaculia bacterium]